MPLESAFRRHFAANTTRLSRRALFGRWGTTLRDYVEYTVVPGAFARVRQPRALHLACHARACTLRVRHARACAVRVRRGAAAELAISHRCAHVPSRCRAGAHPTRSLRHLQRLATTLPNANLAVKARARAAARTLLIFDALAFTPRVRWRFVGA